MNNGNSRWMPGLAAIVFLAGGDLMKAAPIQGGRGPSVSFTLVEPRITLHEPVLVELRVRNDLEEPITFDLGYNRTANLQFGIQRPDGQTATPVRHMEPGLGRLGRISLSPGKAYQQRVLLNEWFDFSSPGNYQIEAKLTSPVQLASGARLGPDAELLKLDILPRDPARLSEICEKLAATAIHSPAAIESSEASLALSYVHDPVSLPFLERVLREGRSSVKLEAIKGLQSQGTGQAVDALIATLNNPDPDVAAVARNALGELQGRMRDEDVKTRIRRALTR